MILLQIEMMTKSPSSWIEFTWFVFRLVVTFGV